MLTIFLSTITVFSMNSDCQTDWVSILSSGSSSSDLPSYYSKMYQYSGFGINSLGNFESCKEIDEAKYVLEIYSNVPLVLVALCGPKSCSESDYYESPLPAIASSGSTGYTVLFPQEYQEEHYGTLHFGAMCMLVFISVIFSIGILATFADHFLGTEKENSAMLRYLLCFSLITNGKKIWISVQRKGDPLELLNGVRVLSMLWIIYGHICLFYYRTAVLSNYDTVVDLFDDLMIIIANGGGYSVDSFFWVSGFLMSYLFILEVNKAQTFPVWKICLVYIHRYLRITPVYAFCTMFFWSMLRYIGNGPVWFHTDEFLGNCEDYWYTNLMYVQNFIPGYREMCHRVSWFLAVQMQLFIVSPIILLIYIKVSRWAGWVIVFVLCCNNIVIGGIVSHRYGFGVFTTNEEDFNDRYYYMPYTRAAPYLLGIACGFVLYTYRKHQEGGEIYDGFALFIARALGNWRVRLGSLGLGVGLYGYLVYGQYEFYINPLENEDDEGWTRFRIDIFIAFERVVFGCLMSFIFLPMMLGYFRPITAFLSLSIWGFLSKFTFVVYLIHVYIMEIILRSQKDVMRLNEYNAIRDTLYIFSVCVVAAVPIILLIEMPALNLETILFHRKPSRELKKN